MNQPRLSKSIRIWIVILTIMQLPIQDVRGAQGREAEQAISKGSILDEIINAKQSVNGTKALTKEEVFSIVEEQFQKTSNERGEVQQGWLGDLAYHPRGLPFRQGFWALLQQNYGVGNPAVVGEGAGYAREVMQAMSTITCILSQPNDDQACSKKTLEYELGMVKFNSGDDFPRVKAFLDEFSAFAQGLPEKKLQLTQKHLAEEHKAFEEQKRHDHRLLEQRKGMEAKEQAVLQQRKEEAAESSAALEELEKQKRARLAEEKRLREEEESKRREQYVEELKAGKQPITNLVDARAYYDAKDGISILLSPLLTPDGGYYYVWGSIEKTESNRIIGKLEGHRETKYFAAEISDSTRFIGKENLRINGMINLIGKYIENVEYTTVIGSSKTMPVFEAVYITTSQ